MNCSHLIPELKQHENWNLLNIDQKLFCISVLEGKNTFLSGAAGTGKSFCYNFIMDFLDGRDINVARTSSTGVSALNVRGNTIHSYFGIGLGSGELSELLKNIFRNKKAIQRVRDCDFVFCDEVSMLSGEFLDKLNAVCNIVCKNRSGKPFAGKTVVFTGDMLQLPPVSKNLLEGEQALMIFESKAWKELKFNNIYLTKIIRQKDEDFANLLNKIRMGETEGLDLLKTRFNAKLEPIDGIEGVRLYSNNFQVDQWNRKKLDEIQGKSKKFIAIDSGDSKKYAEYFNKNCPAPQILELKINAQILLLKNIEISSGLVNGATGKVIGFTKLDEPIIKFASGKTHICERHKWDITEKYEDKDGKIKERILASRSQYPLKLSWCLSIHRSQGLTLSRIFLDLSNCFEFGMAYVGLSRATSLSGLSLKPFDFNRIKAHPKAVQFYKNLEAEMRQKELDSDIF